MYLKTVLIRFFKSFNYDFLRKNHPSAKPEPWEDLDGTWFPFVGIPMMADITTIVGANESGKSHLLGAIEKGLTGGKIQRRDFCRYSQFFTVEAGKMRWPDFGFQFAELSKDDQEILRTAVGLKSSGSIDNFTLIRRNRTTLEVWIPDRDTYTHHSVAEPRKLLESGLLPRVFHIDSSIALPSSVPISWLRGATRRRWPRGRRDSLLAAMETLKPSFLSKESIASGAPAIHQSLSTILEGHGELDGDNERGEEEYELARALLFKVARIDVAAVTDLAEALGQEDEGLANGILQQINHRLAATLNFPRWWVQDSDFSLTVSARDDDLVFTITDRTHTEYSFGERSNGLKYFLSYYIQYLAHEASPDRDEILLMDEPDAFLSSQGQQDLLKIFNSFAYPDLPNRRPVQVVYVTHSPFLIDRNHGERIRVLEKGTDDEGTRVVNDASKNHYEPLRSSFGAFVAETTFIGNCNLMVEGLADQVLLAGCSGYLRARGVPRMNTLDLNRITIVPAGSASHIPYLVYLARGRDIEQPSVIVLLDADAAGKEAEKALQRGGPRGRRVLDPKYVLVISALQSEVQLPPGRTLVETEDLIPPALAAEALRRYLGVMCSADGWDANLISATGLLEAWVDDRTLFDSVGVLARQHVGDDCHVDKVGFARTIAEVMREDAAGTLSLAGDTMEIWRGNCQILLARLAHLQRQAERDSRQERISQRIDRTIKAFLRDHPTASLRENAILLLEDIEGVLDDSLEADAVLMQLQQLRREHDLAEPKAGALERFEDFASGLKTVRYSAVNAVQQAPLTELGRAESQVLPPAKGPDSAEAMPS
jgi:predicted ATPase